MDGLRKNSLIVSSSSIKVKIQNGAKTMMILKTSDGNSMAIIYDGNEFESLEAPYDKDGKTGYSDIMNGFVKDAIKSGSSEIKRHKGTKVVAK